MNFLKKDLDYTLQKLSDVERKKFEGSTILITGCAGFLGYYFMKFFDEHFQKLKIKKVIGLDNFMLGRPKWIDSLKNDKIVVKQFDIISDDISSVEGSDEANLIIHMASVASPVYYRKYPIETLDADVWGLRRLLEFYIDKNISGFLFYSSSEIYGNPDSKHIPTDENYYGYVSCTGPRSCYDESKRFGETICMLFAQKYNLPIVIVRPFNNHGPGMHIEDKRVSADFVKAIFENKDIEILSDGSPTRTFCYIADAIAGYIKILLYGKFDYFNIGSDNPEISMKQLAELYQSIGKKLFNYNGKITFAVSEDKHYLTDNPQRRCPNIDKARRILNFNPEISLEEGIERSLLFMKKYGGELV